MTNAYKQMRRQSEHISIYIYEEQSKDLHCVQYLMTKQLMSNLRLKGFGAESRSDYERFNRNKSLEYESVKK